MKNILYVITQSETGGAQRYVLDLAREMKKEFNVAIAFGGEGEKGEAALLAQKENIRAFTAPSLKREISFKKDFKAARELRRLIKNFRPDIIHLNSSKASIVGSLAAVFTNAKVVYTAHGWAFNELLDGNKKLFYKAAEKITAVFKDKIICVSEADRQAALCAKTAPARKLIAIHNGLADIDFLDRETARARLGLGRDDFAVGSIGNLYKNKGYECLIDAVKILSDKGLSVKAVIIGEGEERKFLEDWIVQNHLSGKIILSGRRPEAAKLLKAFDVYICSSVKEGLPYSVMEAMLARLPVIASRVGGNPELIKDGQTGYLFEPADKENLAVKIEILGNDPAKRELFGFAARETVLRDFILEEMIAATREVYKNK